MKIRKAIRSVLPDGGNIRRRWWQDGGSLRITKDMGMEFQIDPPARTGEVWVLDAEDIIATDWEVVE